ncbi:hypothetical protein C0J52_14402 [Blattella germanica]|nr:hypothetical protein C0J52_14402 [Blattella germanica]
MAAEELHDTLDLTGQGLKKIPKAQPHDAQVVTTLILDNNDLQRWDNIDSYPILKKLSATHNQLLRMYGIARLHGITTLNLSHNSILTIEGLKDLVHLKWLCLAANNIKSFTCECFYKFQQLLLHGNRISQLRQCERHLPPSIVMLTLASNNITDLNEMSHLVHLTNLREFTIMSNPCVNMTGNCIGFDYRPFIINWCMSLKVIDGFVVDAIESLKAEWLYSQGRGRQFRVGEHQALGQYLASVCPLTGDSLQSEDDRKLRLILSKAQQHQQQLREQLTTDGGAIRAKGAILNRSQSSPASSPATRRRINNNRTSSPRRISMSKESKLPVTDRSKMHSPDRMINSCNAMTSNDMVTSMIGNDELGTTTLMTRSLDPSLLFTSSANQDANNSDQSEGSSAQLLLEDCTENGTTGSSSCPLQTATKLVPVPESLMSPDYRPVTTAGMTARGMRPKSSVISTAQRRPIPRGSPKLSRSLHSSPLLSRQRGGQAKQCSIALARRRASPQRIGQSESAQVMSSEDEDSEMSASKLETIRHRAQERWQRKEATSNTAGSNTEHAAVCIQRMWRGYHTRNLNRRVMAAYHDINASRTQEYIQKLSSDMEATRAALESERKLQLLQMQAINALWKKVCANCYKIILFVEQLQDSMQSVMQCMSMFCQKGQVVPPRLADDIETDGNESANVTGGTQTDIIAVHTPQMESGPGMPFPYQRTSPSTRPSSLPISQSRPPPSRNPSAPPEPDAPQELKQFATSLVDGVLRTVAEQGGETETEVENETGSPLDDVNEKSKDEDIFGSKEDITENDCVTVIEKEKSSCCDKEECRENGNSAFEDARQSSIESAELEMQNAETEDENNPCVVISSEAPSTPSSPFEQLDSPNNNQHPIHGNVVQ